jgi:uncharacterized protein YcnI
MSGRTLRRLLVGTASLALAVPAVADAHIQVRPATAAPNDPVEFTVLVPSERDAHTTTVDLKLPPGLLPFAYGDAPGWKRRLVTAPNGAVERIVWTGRLATDGYATFRFLASTPERPTTLTWKALQHYDDGTVARWIGSPDSESPAPVTRVLAGAARQNAGGEGEDADAATPTAAPAAAPTAAADDDGGDDLALVLALVALVVALGGTALALRRRSA